MHIKWLSLIVSIGVSLLAGIIGSFFTFDAIPTWYAFLNKPFFSPPNWIFGPVWTTLYILMGISLYIIWQSKKSTKRTQALILFGVQIVLNAVWSILFFGLQSPLVAFIEIIILLFAILLTAKYMYSISKVAGYLFIPYICWVTFASILNFAIYLLN